MKCWKIAAAAVALGLTAAPALAATADDAKCLVAFTALADKATDKTEEAQIGAMAMYFGGRVVTTVSGQDLKALLQASAPPFTDEGLGRAAEQCMQAIEPQVRALSDATKFIDQAMGKD